MKYRHPNVAVVRKYIPLCRSIYHYVYSMYQVPGIIQQPYGSIYIHTRYIYMRPITLRLVPRRGEYAKPYSCPRGCSTVKLEKITPTSSPERRKRLPLLLRTDSVTCIGLLYTTPGPKYVKVFSNINSIHSQFKRSSCSGTYWYLDIQIIKFCGCRRPHRRSEFQTLTAMMVAHRRHSC